MNKVKEAPVPKDFRKFLALITDQLFYIDDDIVVLTEPQLKKAKFSYDDTQFFLNAMNKHNLYSSLTKRYGLNFLPVPKKAETKERLLSAWNWQMGLPDKLIEFQYLIKIASRDALYEFCGLPVERRPVRGKTIKNRHDTDSAFLESRSQGEDHHILLGDRSGKNQKAHMIVDGKTGEQRVEDGRGEPTDTAPHIETTVTFQDGKRIRTTRTQLEELPSKEHGSKRAEVAYNLNYSLLKVRDAIKGVRNPAIWNSEFEAARKYSKEKNPENSDEFREKNSSALVYEMRWEEITKALKDLDSNVLAAEVLWGTEVVNLVRPLHKKITELTIALRQHFNPDLRTKDFMELHDTIYNQGHEGEEDGFGKEVSDIIKKVDEYLKTK